jgi:hypothetical protein
MRAFARLYILLKDRLKTMAYEAAYPHGKLTQPQPLSPSERGEIFVPRFLFTLFAKQRGSNSETRSG